MLDDFMTSQDIAETLGVKLTTVHQYRTRGELPDPDAHVGRSPVWRKATIEEWLEERPGHGWRKGNTEKT